MSVTECCIIGTDCAVCYRVSALHQMALLAADVMMANLCGAQPLTAEHSCLPDLLEISCAACLVDHLPSRLAFIRARWHPSMHPSSPPLPSASAGGSRPEVLREAHAPRPQPRAQAGRPHDGRVVRRGRGGRGHAGSSERKRVSSRPGQGKWSAAEAAAAAGEHWSESEPFCNCSSICSSGSSTSSGCCVSGISSRSAFSCLQSTATSSTCIRASSQSRSQPCFTRCDGRNDWKRQWWRQ